MILDYFGEGVRLVGDLQDNLALLPGVLYTHTIRAEFQGNRQFAATEGTFPIAAEMQRVDITAQFQALVPHTAVALVKCKPAISASTYDNCHALSVSLSSEM